MAGVQTGYFTKGLAGVADGGSGDLFRGAFGYNGAAAFAAFGPEVDHPVGGFDDVQVVLDDDDGMAGIDQSAERLCQEDADIVEMQTGGGFIEDEEDRFVGDGATAPKPRTAARWLTSLRRWLSPPDRVLIGWPKAQVAQADFLQEFQALDRPPRRGAGWSSRARNSITSSTVASNRSAMLQCRLANAASGRVASRMCGR
jgi:hypothetical protein